MAFLFIFLVPISDSLFCYLLHVLPVQKTTIISRESEIILLTARYEDWSALARKNANANAKANAKGIIYRYKRKYKHSEVCTRIYHNAAHKVDFLAFKLPHRRVKCGGRLPLPVFVFYARKSREIKKRLKARK